ncbi:MAG: glycerophosphoryl diester phosphodiesterase membrane domain-containing protein [Solobacterium sp.]|nr:glycerophosphoryl diester phosphodiesterase membrane domain-containing protein [Solobacterium sp.]
MTTRRKRLKPYLESVSDILTYQAVTKILITIWLYILGRLFRILLNSTGRVAVSTGDFTFLFTTWQGILIILIAIVSLFIYVALDLNAKIIMSKNFLYGEKVSILKASMEALDDVKRLFNVEGILVVIYIALIAPVVGVGLSITLTKGFYIPTFISSVIMNTPAYLILAIIVVIVFAIVGIMNLFLLHGVVVDKMSVKEASIQSRQLMHDHWKDYLKQNLLFIGVMAVVLISVTLVALVLPLALTELLPLSFSMKRSLTIFFVIEGVLISFLTDLIATPFYIMKMTQLYLEYKTGKDFSYTERPIRSYRFFKIMACVALIGIVILTIALNKHFDEVFPLNSSVAIIAHRGGGNEAAENTVSGVETAYQKGAYGSEIDIQRTKDGHYVINHDGNFARVAGDNRKPEEMTLAEVKQLSVNGEPIPTLEEILEASRGKVTLFVELKGATADQQMVDDAVRIIKEKKMEDETIIISLKYDLINYLETKYPEMHSGFLTFASFGDTAKLNCDYLGLEEESATAGAISDIHKQGKKALIWTVNEKGFQRHFLCSKADAIITDNITQANTVKDEIKNRSYLSRMIDTFRGLLG